MLWLPDTFGYSAALPQILKGCGIKYMVTQKIFWSYNDDDKFPYHYFNWQGMDGTRIASFLPTSYTYRTHPTEINEVWKSRRQVRDLDTFLLPFGYGDGGGGPSRDFIEYALRQKDLEGTPRVKMSDPVEFFEDMQEKGGPKNTYVGELYFSCHRGTFTSQAMIKKYNRRSELALREMELWAALAAQKGAEYPKEAAERLWKQVLLHQFHDILPGSSIARVYEEAEKVYEEVLTETGSLCAAAQAKLLAQDDGEAVTVFNSLGFERKTVVTLPAAFEKGVARADGRVLPVWKTPEGIKAVVTLPPCGAVSLRPTNTASTVQTEEALIRKTENGFVMDNGLVTAGINDRGRSGFLRPEGKRQRIRCRELEPAASVQGCTQKV